MARQPQTRRNVSNHHGHRWISALFAVIIAVLLVTFGAQLAHGPTTGTAAVASNRVAVVTKPAANSTVTGSNSTPSAVAVTGTPTGPSVTPPSSQQGSNQLASAAEPALHSATTGSDASSQTLAPAIAKPPATPNIQEGASPAAASALQAFIERNQTMLVLGQSTTPEFTVANSGIVGQYFSNAILEYHPELAGTPYVVELTRVGVAIAEANGLLQTTAFQPLPAGTQSDANCSFVAATMHRLCAGFRTYWRSQGLNLGDPGTSYRESLALYGYPISEEFTDPTSGRTVQYFERGVLEYDATQPPAKRVKDVSETDAVLTRWQYQIVAGVDRLLSGG